MIVWSGYTLSALMSCFAVVNNLYYSSIDFTYQTTCIAPLFFLLTTNLIISLPFRKIDERKIELTRINTDLPIYKAFVYFSLFFFFIISIMKIYEATAIQTVSSYSDVYQMMNDGDSTKMLRDLLYTNSFLRTLSGIGGSYCPTMAPLIIIYLFNKVIKKRELKIETVFCFIITLIPVVLHGVTNASRGGIFFEMFQLLFFYMIIRPYLKKKIRKIFLIGSILVLTLFWGISYAITESRLETRQGSYTAYEEIMIYFGQPMLNVCYYQDKIKYHPMGKRFLDIREGGENQTFKDYWNNKTGAQVQIFKTYYGDVYLEFGLVGAFLFVILYTSAWNSVVLKKYRQPLFIPFVWYYFLTLIFGVFDFKNLFNIYSIWLFILILLCIYISSKSNFQSKILIQSKNRKSTILC